MVIVIITPDATAYYQVPLYYLQCHTYITYHDIYYGYIGYRYIFPGNLVPEVALIEAST